MRIHVINHHFWPDGSPSAVLEEELADALRDRGFDTVLVCGSGSFHDVTRPEPASPIIRLGSGETGARDRQGSILRDYHRFFRAVKRYVRSSVGPGDAVLATSSPFLNSFLARTIRRTVPSARLVFHLHDYLPSNLKSLSLPHRLASPVVRWLVDRSLARWDLVVSCAANIAYHGPNSVVARFWPTIAASERRVDRSVRRALYAGNLGIAHDIDAFVTEITRLRDEGWQVDVHGDGPGVALLPDWVSTAGLVSGEAYLDILYSHPLHLVVGVRGNGTGAFPSKTINSLHVGAEVRPCGFLPEMLEELRALQAIPDLARNLDVAADIVADFLRGYEPVRIPDDAG